MTEEQRLRRSKRWDWVLVVLMAATMLVVTVTGAQRVGAEQSKDAAVSTASQLAERVDEVCTQGGPAADELGGICERAAEVVEQPALIVTPGVDGVDGRDGEDGRDGRDGADGDDGRDGRDGADGDDGRDGKDGEDGRDGRNGADAPGLTAAQVRDAVTAVFAASPGIPEDEVEQQVVAYLTVNPPKDGRDGKDGQDGKPGKPGRAPTHEELVAAVADYCSTGACQPPAGTVCTDGFRKVRMQAWLRHDRHHLPRWVDVEVCRETRERA